MYFYSVSFPVRQLEKKVPLGMNTDTPKLCNAPIVEAVLDIDCDTPPDVELADLEDAAYERFGDRYPQARKQFSQEVQLQSKPEGLSSLSTRHALQALQFLTEDEKQLVQLRAQGFSFNRLAPYSSLDDYLPEIERTWRRYGEVAAPVTTRAVRLRYINRIALPMEDGTVDLDGFLEIAPRSAAEESLSLTGFLIQQNAFEKESHHHVSLTLRSQSPENKTLPIILDIAVSHPLEIAPSDWDAIYETVQSLRRLKNRVFRNTLTERCMQLFQ